MEAAFEHGAFVFRILPPSHPISANTAERMERANQPGIEIGTREGCMAHGREERNIRITNLPRCRILTHGQSLKHGYRVVRVSTIVSVA